MSAPVVRAPPSKSLTHRALLMGAFSSNGCVVRNVGLGADNRSTLACLRAWGADFELDEDAATVTFRAFEPRAPTSELDCGNSGTTLRLLLGQAARFPFTTTLTGDDSLRTRPNGPLLDALIAMGVAVESHDGRAPITVRGPLAGTDAFLPGGLSSQYASSLMLALAQTPGRSTLRLRPPVASRPYLDLTFLVAEAFGLGLTHEEDDGLTVSIPGGRRPSAQTFTVPGDWSGAAFPIVAAAITGRTTEVRGVVPDDPQGDRAIVELVRRSGATVEATEDGVLVSGRALRGLGEVNVGATPDLFPILVALAAAVSGETRLVGSPGLRHKECDRISAMAAGLAAMGGDVQELPDGAIVRGTPGTLHAATIETFHDHRIHMAFAVLDTIAGEASRIAHPECVAVSYPHFHEDLAGIVGA